MTGKPLEYKLLHPSQQAGPATAASIIYTVEMLANFISLVSPESKPRIVVDNNSVSMRQPTSKIITAAGYIPGRNALFLYSPTVPSQMAPLAKPLEEMTQEELLESPTAKPIGPINPQLLVALRDYVLNKI